MMYRFLVLLLCSIFMVNAHASQENKVIGARAMSMGGAAVTQTDVYSANNNQAGLAGITNIGGGIYTERRFMLADLSLHAGAVAVPTNSGTFGLSLQYFGYKLYNDKKIGLGFGKQFSDRFSGGIQLDYLSTFITEYGTKSAFTFEIGLQAAIARNFSMGAHLYNPLRIKMSDQIDETLPSIIKIGFAYTPSDKLMLVAEAEKDIHQKPVIKAGMEYQLIEMLYLRAGISNNPTYNAFGIGLNLNSLKIDIATSFHPVLGTTPHLGISYQLDKKKTKPQEAPTTE